MKRELQSRDESNPPRKRVKLNIHRQDCPICLKNVQNAVVLQGCLHTFCRECIERWGRISNNLCPICKTKYSAFLADVHSNREFRIETLGQEHAAKDLSPTEYRRRVAYIKNERTPVFTSKHIPGPEKLATMNTKKIKDFLIRELKAITLLEILDVLYEIVWSSLKRHPLDQLRHAISAYLETHAEMFVNEIRAYLSHPSFPCSLEEFDAFAARCKERQNYHRRNTPPPMIDLTSPEHPAQIDLTEDQSSDEDSDVCIVKT